MCQWLWRLRHCQWLVELAHWQVEIQFLMARIPTFGGEDGTHPEFCWWSSTFCFWRDVFFFPDFVGWFQCHSCWTFVGELLWLSLESPFFIGETPTSKVASQKKHDRIIGHGLPLFSISGKVCNWGIFFKTCLPWSPMVQWAGDAPWPSAGSRGASGLYWLRGKLRGCGFHLLRGL